MRASLKQKILEVCDRKISEKGAGVGVFDSLASMVETIAAAGIPSDRPSRP